MAEERMGQTMSETMMMEETTIPADDFSSMNNWLERINTVAETEAKLVRLVTGEICETLDMFTKIDQLLYTGDQASCQSVWEVKSSLGDKKDHWEQRRAVVRDNYHKIKEEKIILSARLEQIKNELNEITESNKLLESEGEPKIPLLLSLLSADKLKNTA